MRAGLKFENNNDIGVFAKLTNAYCLTAVGSSENFNRCGGKHLMRASNWDVYHLFFLSTESP